MQPGPATSLATAVLLAIASFWTGSVVHRPATLPDLVQEVPLTAAPAGGKRRRRRSVVATTTPAPPPVEAPSRVATKRRKKRSAADREGNSSGTSFTALATVAVASLLVGAFARQQYGPPAAAASELVELAPGLANDGRRSPTKAAPAAPATPLELGIVGDRALLASLARREVRQ